MAAPATELRANVVNSGLASTTTTTATNPGAPIVPALTIASVDSVVAAARSDDVNTRKDSAKPKDGTKRYPPWLENAIRKSLHSQKVWANATNASFADASADTKAASRPSTPNNNNTSRDKTCSKAINVASDTTTKAKATKPTNVFEAARRNDAEAMEAFIDVLGARIFKHDDHQRAGGTVLHEACENGSLEVVKQLLLFADDRLGYGFCTEIVNEVDSVYSGTTPLIAVCRGLNGFIASRLEILRLLVKYEAIVEACDGHGDNALHWCARHSRLPLLRMLLKETDAAAHAIFMENYRMEKAIDIAKKIVTRKRSMETMSVYNLLRSFDANCNVRLKIQVVKRLQGNRRTELLAKDQVEAHIATEQATNNVNTAQQLLHEALGAAERYRQQKQQDFMDSKAHEALVAAKEYLESRDGKRFVSQRMASVIEEIKNEISASTGARTASGGNLKTKDLKKAANDRIEDTFYAEKQQEARDKARKVFESSHPSYPSATEWRKLGDLV